jgi:hypothetical protein
MSMMKPPSPLMTITTMMARSWDEDNVDDEATIAPDDDDWQDDNNVNDEATILPDDDGKMLG